MPTARFFIPPEWVALSSEAFSLPAGQLHKQITHVLRMQVGDELILLPNDGTEITGHITVITRNTVAGIISRSRVFAPITPAVTVCAAITKRDTFEWMLQKCTELGVHAFLPLHTERTVKKTTGIGKRWHDIVKEAAEQSGRTTIPLLHDIVTFAQALAKTEHMARIVMHEQDGTKTLPPLQKSMPIALFIGPEGGFSSQEIILAKNMHAHIFTFGHYIFRAETAAVVGCTKFLT